jgi:hypothetical protein
MFTVLGVQGKVSTKAAAPSCSVCNNGNYQNDTGKYMCDTCLAGRYKKEQVFEGNPSFLYLCVSDDVFLCITVPSFCILLLIHCVFFSPLPLFLSSSLTRNNALLVSTKTKNNKPLVCHVFPEHMPMKKVLRPLAKFVWPTNTVAIPWRRPFVSVVPQVGLRPMAVQNARCAARVNTAMLLAVVAKLVPPVVFERRLIYQQNVNFAWPERTKTKHNKPLVCHA